MSAKLGWQIASRVLAAALGGYALSALAMADLALLLPRVGGATPAEAVLLASLCSFVLYTGVALWVFATRSAGRAWAGIALAGLALALLFLGLRE
ncbi:DUF3649 domain-containing protein [Pseudorhodoferax sp.]|uniref:DUF3649 domain-containing protein n=1 Tax=Pseudorhodoferax sp. TaxID=1993553 RepID=UPI002DD6B1AF|nr:DUF3649 domain-containing protein [Pseudorhodoferax sp.]